MASNYTTLNDLFTAIADAIRAKKQTTDAIVADNFPAEIEGLRSGFDYVNSEVTSIADNAFYGCEDLNTVDCPNITSVGANAFKDCANLKSVILYDDVTSVGENAFQGCDDVIIYYKGTSIPETWDTNWNPDDRPVLCGEPIETWDISATSEDNVAAKLYSAGGKYTLFIDGVGSMEKNSWESSAPWNTYRENITNVYINNGVTSISEYAFSKTNLTSVTIPDSVTSIGSSAFSSTNLTSVTIPDSVTSIGSNAFYGTHWLTAKQQESAFVIVNNILIDGKTCSGEVTIPNSVTVIGDGAFRYCSSLTSVTIPNSVTSIGWQAFDESSLTSVTIPNSVTTIGNSAFAGSNLTSVTIPNSVTNIGRFVFMSCVNLTSVTIPDSVTAIGNGAFSFSYRLTSITYSGTIAQWKTIEFDGAWAPDAYYTIYCIDGDIDKDGTITYHDTTT